MPPRKKQPKKTTIPRFSGFAHIAPPLADITQKTWGAPLLENLERYYDLYTSVPYIRSGIDTLAGMAARNGISVDEDTGAPDVRTYVAELLKQLFPVSTLREIIRLGLVYGTAFAEIIYEYPPDTVPYESLRPQLHLPNALQESEYDKFIIDEKYAAFLEEEAEIRSQVGEPLYLKTLDSRFMRVLGDSKGRIWGYIQWVPPLTYLRRYHIFHWVHDRRSELYEWFYGNSLLRSVLRIQTIITQLENDITMAIHFQAFPPIKARIGSDTVKPTPAQFDAVKNELISRPAGGNIIVPWFADVEWMQQPAGVISRVEWFFRHLLREREQALGVARLFFGEVGGVSRSVGEFLLAEAENKIETIRQTLEEAIMEQIIKPCVAARFPDMSHEDIPELKWSPAIPATLRDKILTLVDLSQSQGIDDELRQKVIQTLRNVIDAED
ncbi:MAG: hypothetical protein QXD61_07910 [Candidatus Caldarchaeum sp.]